MGRTVGGSLRVRLTFAVVAVASLVAGYVGLLFFAGTNPGFRTHWPDLVYWDLQLFVLSSAPVESGRSLPVLLQLARFGAPLATAYALFSTAQAIFGSELERLRTQRAKGHTIVCGLEPAPVVLASELLAAGESVVIVATGAGTGPTGSGGGAGPGGAGGAGAVGSPEPPQGAHLVVGDARSESVLRRAGVTRARDVMAVTSDSAFNAEVGLIVRDLAAREGITLPCHAEIADRQLCAAMVAATRSPGVQGAAPLHFFNRHDRTARDLLEHSPLLGLDPADASVLVAGGGSLGQAVLLEIGRLWHQRTRHDSPPLPVAVLDPGGDVGRQLTQAPLPPGALDLAVRDLDPRSVTTVGDLLVGAGDGGDRARQPAHVFVCLDDDLAALRFGLTAVRLLDAAEVVVAVTTGTVFGELLTTVPGSGSGPAGRLRLHNVIHTVYASRSVRREQTEEMARAAHSAYVAAALARGETRSSNPSMAPWDDLGDDLQRANLAQAADIERKLDVIDCVVTPTPSNQPFSFTEAELELLAELEHERWMDERRSQGWTPGSPRDNVAKIHPDMVDWDQLGDVSREKDRDAVREIPEQLRNAGLGIARRPSST